MLLPSAVSRCGRGQDFAPPEKLTVFQEQDPLLSEPCLNRRDTTAHCSVCTCAHARGAHARNGLATNEVLELGEAGSVLKSSIEGERSVPCLACSRSPAWPFRGVYDLETALLHLLGIHEVRAEPSGWSRALDMQNGVSLGLTGWLTS